MQKPIEIYGHGVSSETSRILSTAAADIFNDLFARGADVIAVPNAFGPMLAFTAPGGGEIVISFRYQPE